MGAVGGSVSGVDAGGVGDFGLRIGVCGDLVSGGKVEFDGMAK